MRARIVFSAVRKIRTPMDVSTEMDQRLCVNGDETTVEKLLAAAVDRTGKNDFGRNNYNYTNGDEKCHNTSAKITTKTVPISVTNNRDDHYGGGGGNRVRDECKSQSPPLYFGSTFRKTENAGDLQNESKVLVIYTGGTIGMIRNDENGEW